MTPESASGVGSNPASGIGDRIIGIIPSVFSYSCLLPPIKCCGISRPRIVFEAIHGGSNPPSTIGVQPYSCVFSKCFSPTARHPSEAGTVSYPFYATHPRPFLPISIIKAVLSDEHSFY